MVLGNLVPHERVHGLNQSRVARFDAHGATVGYVPVPYEIFPALACIAATPGGISPCV